MAVTAGTTCCRAPLPCAPVPTLPACCNLPHACPPASLSPSRSCLLANTASHALLLLLPPPHVTVLQRACYQLACPPPHATLHAGCSQHLPSPPQPRAFPPRARHAAHYPPLCHAGQNALVEQVGLHSLLPPCDVARTTCTPSLPAWEGLGGTACPPFHHCSLPLPATPALPALPATHYLLLPGPPATPYLFFGTSYCACHLTHLLHLYSLYTCTAPPPLFPPSASSSLGRVWNGFRTRMGWMT